MHIPYDAQHNSYSNKDKQAEQYNLYKRNSFGNPRSDSPSKSGRTQDFTGGPSTHIDDSTDNYIANHTNHNDYNSRNKNNSEVYGKPFLEMNDDDDLEYYSEISSIQGSIFIFACP